MFTFPTPTIPMITIPKPVIPTIPMITVPKLPVI
jgi:hypothetical protein